MVTESGTFNPLCKPISNLFQLIYKSQEETKTSQTSSGEIWHLIFSSEKAESLTLATKCSWETALILETPPVLKSPPVPAACLRVGSSVEEGLMLTVCPLHHKEGGCWTDSDCGIKT